MPYTLQQFGQAVRKKYPNLKGSDEEVAAVVISQYPEYAQWVSDPALESDTPEMIDPQLGSVNAQNYNQSQAFEPQATPTTSGAPSEFKMSNAFSGQSQPQQPSGASFGAKVLSGAGKVANFIGDVTGIKGVGKAVVGAYDVLQSGGKLDEADKLNEEATSLLNQASRSKDANERQMLRSQARELLNQAEGIATKESADLAQAPTARQALGSTAKVALTAAGGAATKAAGAVYGAAGRIGASTLTGAGYGTAEALEDNTSIKKGATVGAVTGLAAGALTEGVRWAVNNLPKRFMGSVSGLTNKQMANKKGQDAIKMALDKNKIGTRSGLIKQSERIIAELGDKVDDGIAKAGNPKVSFKDVYGTLAQKYRNSGLGPKEIQQLIANQTPAQRVLLESSKPLTAMQVNELRSAVGRSLREVGFINNANSLQKDIVGDFYFALHDKVDEAVPGVRNLIAEQGKEITFLRGLEAAAAKAGNNKTISLGDWLSGAMFATGGGGVGGAIGGAMGGGVGAPVGAALGVGVSKALSSTPVNTAAAVGLKGLGKILQRTSPVIRQSILNAINEAAQRTTK